MKYYLLTPVALLIALQVPAADVRLMDCSDISHPKSLENQVGEVRIVSESNSNSRYFLQICADKAFPVGCESISLMVGDHKIGFNSQGPKSIETIVDDRTVIPQIAQQFHATVLNRHHPGQQMLVQFIPEKPEFTSSNRLIVTLRITNVGKHDFTFMKGGRQRGDRDNQFAFSAQKDGGMMVADSGNPINYGGIGFPVTLKPSQSHEIKVDLTKWFKFEPNTGYEIRGSYYMSFIDPESKRLDTIWEDYACDEFRIETNP